MKNMLYQMCIGFVLLCSGCADMATATHPADTALFKGRITVYAIDNFKERKSQTSYALKLDGNGKLVSLNFADPTNIPDLRSGMLVEVLGQQQQDMINVKRIIILSSP